jgi:hypothetical protein
VAENHVLEVSVTLTFLSNFHLSEKGGDNIQLAELYSEKNNTRDHAYRVQKLVATCTRTFHTQQ